MQQLFNEWKRRIFKNCKQSTRQDSTNFIHSIWIDMTKQPTEFHFFLLCEKMKIKVSSV